MDREGAANKWFKLRMIVVLLLCAAGFGAILHKAWTLQIVDGAKFREMAEEQYLKEIELPAKRGTITDRNGVELAVSTEIDSVFMVPALFKRDRAGAPKTK
ncbi:MAG: hypothetical protein WC889_08560, partial [Myxococcota bacterium]